MSQPREDPKTVADLIEYLKLFDPNLPVCYQCHSEWCEFEPGSIKVQELQPARVDGWVGNPRPDRTTVTYLTFPGN